MNLNMFVNIVYKELYNYISFIQEKYLFLLNCMILV